MRILVTGGAGFIASHIVEAYLAAGHDVIVVDNLVTGRREYVNSKAIFYEADVCDKDQIQMIFNKEKPEVLNHHAAQMDVRKSVADPQYDAHINLIGLLNLMEAGKNDLKQVIFASSGGAIYGDTDKIPTSETEGAHPASPYGISKLASEYYLNFYFQTYGISYTALRYGNVYGPRQNPHGEAGVVAIFINKLIAGETPTINGDGKQTRDFVYVKDIVAANEKALLKNQVDIFNIGTGLETDINTIFMNLAQICQLKVLEKHGDPKLGEQKRSCLNAQKAFVGLGWKPTVSLSAGLKETVNFFKNQII